MKTINELLQHPDISFTEFSNAISVTNIRRILPMNAHVFQAAFRNKSAAPCLCLARVY